MAKEQKYKNVVENIGPLRVRSKLEKYCYEALEQAGVPFNYEEIRFNLLSKGSYENCIESKSKSVPGKTRKTKIFEHSPRFRSVTYTPDFSGTYAGRSWIIETKGMKTPAFNIKWKMLKEALKEYKLDYDLYMPSNRKQINETIKIIKNGGIQKNLGNK